MICTLQQRKYRFGCSVKCDPVRLRPDLPSIKIIGAKFLPLKGRKVALFAGSVFSSRASFERVRNSGNNMQAADRLTVPAFARKKLVRAKETGVLVRSLIKKT